MSAGLFVRATRNLLHRLIRKSEDVLGVKSDHMHFIIDTSLRAFVDLVLDSDLPTGTLPLPTS